MQKPSIMSLEEIRITNASVVVALVGTQMTIKHMHANQRSKVHFYYDEATSSLVASLPAAAAINICDSTSIAGDGYGSSRRHQQHPMVRIGGASTGPINIAMGNSVAGDNNIVNGQRVQSGCQQREPDFVLYADEEEKSVTVTGAALSTIAASAGKIVVGRGVKYSPRGVTVSVQGNGQISFHEANELDRQAITVRTKDNGKVDFTGIEHTNIAAFEVHIDGGGVVAFCNSKITTRTIAGTVRKGTFICVGLHVTQESTLVASAGGTVMGASFQYRSK